MTTNISVAHMIGTSFCVYNSQFVFVHIGVEVPSKLEAKDTLAILPSDIKMQAVGNIGIVSTAGSIASISIENNFIYTNPTFPQGYYLINLLVACIVAIWIICNEIISILENIKDMGVAIPGFLLPIVEHVKSQVEDKADINKDSEGE